MKHLVIGGARSGKSRYAEVLAERSGLDVVYVATARAEDAEMAKRLEQHRLRRPSEWAVVEEPLELATSIRDASSSARCVIVDCLTLWLANLQVVPIEERADRIDELCAVLPQLGGTIVLVSNELGLGVVPANAVARAFRDTSGMLHQRIADAVDTVDLVVAGRPIRLHGRPPARQSTLEITLLGTAGEQPSCVAVTIGDNSLLSHHLPRPFYERIVAEGFDLDGWVERRLGIGETSMLEVKSSRGTLRIELRSEAVSGP